MKPKLKRIIAIIGLSSMLIGSVFFILYMFNQTMLNNLVGVFAVIFLGIGVLCYFFILFNKGFPYQERKIEERNKLEQDYNRKLAENQEAETESPISTESELELEPKPELELEESEPESES